ncbi:hypothetical protein Csa_018510 [Cucumis sativus]|uniref:Uncharacterized protein n=1 Tax=Cucumis sativus TaxID=3659 RepID=A0A0A0KJB9_CUCSA|nr:hypothetical protein Csa_018510 [Cucumis sativus]
MTRYHSLMTHSKNTEDVTLSLVVSPRREVLKEAKEAVREDVYADDEDYTLKFFDDYVCKPMSSGFEDEIQCQSNFQEMHFQSQKQLEDFKLKLDNKNHHHQVQIEGLKAKMQELILQEQELKVQNQVIMEMVKQTTRWNDVQFTSALRYLYSSMCSIIPTPHTLRS